MRSLLSQLLHHIRDHGVDPGDFLDKILKQKSEGTLSLDDLKKLCDLLSRAASFFRYEPIIVIDALDECADIETLLPVLVTLSQRCSIAGDEPTRSGHYGSFRGPSIPFLRGRNRRDCSRHSVACQTRA